MGLFNSGKNDKVEKVDKYGEHKNVQTSKSHRRSSKPRPKNVAPIVRPMPHTSLFGNNLTPNVVYPPSIHGNYSPFKSVYPYHSPYDLSKYNPYMFGQNYPPIWSNGISPFNDRSPFQQQQQQPLNVYQQNGWPCVPPSTNGYMPPMNF